MSSRPPLPPPIYPSQSGAAAVEAVAAAPPAPSSTMTEAHPHSTWPYALPPPHLLANPYTRLPPPAHLQQLPKPPSHSVQSGYGSFQYQHTSPLHRPPPSQTTKIAPRWSAIPIDRLLSHQAYTPPAKSQPHSPRRALQISPRTESGPRPTQRRTLDSPQQLEDPGRIFHQGPPLPSPSYTAHRDSESSHHSSRTASSSFAPGSAPLHHADAASTSQASPTNIASRYKLTVRQQPLAARACGFGERDRRVIDPPPIVQLTLADFDVNSPMDISELRYPFNVVHCTLLSSSSPSTDVTAITDPSSHRTTRRLMGTLVASPFVGGDPDAQPSSSSTDPNSNKPSQPLSCFFIFPDLSCRTPGPYRLHFTLMRLGSEITLLGGRTQIVSSATSEVFQVFSAKDFPGMRASTGLTRGLKKLGAGVSVKKGNGGNGKGSKDGNYQENEGSSEENDDRDEESGDEAKGRERARGRAKKRRKG